MSSNAHASGQNNDSDSTTKTAVIECAICWNDTDDRPNEYVALIGCGHVAHACCIDQWCATKLSTSRTWSCPICRQILPYKMQTSVYNAFLGTTALPKPDQYFIRGYTAIQLDFDTAAGPGAEATAKQAILEARIKELEKQIKKEKEEKEHWMKCYEVAEVTHAELMDLRARTHRLKVAELRKEIDAYKFLHDPAPLKRKDSGSSQRSAYQYSARAKRETSPVGQKLDKGKAPEVADVEVQKLLRQCTDKTSPYYQSPTVPAVPIFQFAIGKPRQADQIEVIPTSEAERPLQERRTLPSRPSSPVAAFRPIIVEPSAPPREVVYNFRFNEMRGLPPVPSFRAKGKEREIAPFPVSKGKTHAQKINKHVHAIPSAIRGIYRGANELSRVVLLPFASLDAMSLPASVSEIAGEILRNWSNRALTMAVEEDQDDYSPKDCPYERSLGQSRVNTTVSAINLGANLVAREKKVTPLCISCNN